jgi:pentatricopeptide repeat protein
MKQHRLVRAEEMFSRALGGYDQAFGPNLTLRFQMINMLYIVYRRQGKPEEAEKMYQRALGRAYSGTLS